MHDAQHLIILQVLHILEAIVPVSTSQLIVS